LEQISCLKNRENSTKSFINNGKEREPHPGNPGMYGTQNKWFAGYFPIYHDEEQEEYSGSY